MLAHYHGGIWNAAEAARSLGVSEPTARRYLDVLTKFFMARQLRPWHENLNKRQVKAPKVYLRDSGLLHALLGLAGERDVLSHPKAGASWEGFAIEDTLFVHGRRYGVEVKFQDTPRLTPSMRIALEDLGLRHLTVLYPGERRYQLERRVDVVPLAELATRGAEAVIGGSRARPQGT